MHLRLTDTKYFFSVSYAGTFSTNLSHLPLLRQNGRRARESQTSPRLIEISWEYRVFLHLRNKKSWISMCGLYIKFRVVITFTLPWCFQADSRTLGACIGPSDCLCHGLSAEGKEASINAMKTVKQGYWNCFQRNSVLFFFQRITFIKESMALLATSIFDVPKYVRWFIDALVSRRNDIIVILSSLGS